MMSEKALSTKERLRRIKSDIKFVNTRLNKVAYDCANENFVKNDEKYLLKIKGIDEVLDLLGDIEKETHESTRLIVRIHNSANFPKDKGWKPIEWEPLLSLPESITRLDEEK